VSPGKLPITIETCIPDQNGNNNSTTSSSSSTTNNNHHNNNSTTTPVGGGGTTTNASGPCIVNGAGTSKIFQILYRNEEVSLRDVIMFRAHLLGEDFVAMARARGILI
jgi:hypothetical protein